MLRATRRTYGRMKATRPILADIVPQYIFLHFIFTCFQFNLVKRNICSSFQKFHTIQSLRYHLQHFHGIRTEVPNPASSSSSSGHSQHSMFENQVIISHIIFRIGLTINIYMQVVPRVNRIGNPQSHIEVKRIYVRQSLNEDPHVWPKVLMSRHLNDFINATYM